MVRFIYAKLHPVCGVHVILSDNLEEVEESTRRAKENGKAGFIKVKLFGKNGWTVM